MGYEKLPSFLQHEELLSGLCLSPWTCSFMVSEKSRAVVAVPGSAFLVWLEPVSIKCSHSFIGG